MCGAIVCWLAICAQMRVAGKGGQAGVGEARQQLVIIISAARAQVYAAPTQAPTGMPWLRAQAAWAKHQQHHWAHLGYA
eukprot:232912-Alexandrium_andersonii.AAC.1